MDADHLPAAIVAPAEALAQRLAHWAAAHREASLAELETEVQAALQTVAPALVEGLVATTQRSLEPALQRAPSRCPDCGQPTRARRWRTRQVATTCGVIRFRRPWAHCARCRRGWSPTDRTLGLAPQQRHSAPFEAWLIRLGGATAFAEAARLLIELTGRGVSPETIRSVTEATGAALDQAQRADRATVERTRAPAGPVDAAPDQLVAETDGVMVHFRDGWHEIKLGVVGGWTVDLPRARQRLLAPSYIAARESAAAFAGRWGAEVARRGGLEEVAYAGTGVRPGIATLRRVLVLGDGARWIWSAAADQFGERIEIVDWYHATEHVWAVARAVAGDGTPAAARWAEASLEQLWAGGAAALLERLRTVAPAPVAARVVATERGYFQTNRERMRYPEFRAQGLPIGSGAVESIAKHVNQYRLKRSGCRWSDAGGQAMAVLRAHQATALARAA
jgi:hypothetical protein